MLKTKAYVREMVERHRQHPERTPFMAALLDAETNDKLTADELAGTISIIIYAAHEATSNLLGNGLYSMLVHREQWDKLCADPSLSRKAVAETLRWNPPVHMMTRLASQDIDFAGEHFPKGTQPIILYGSANRDDEEFSQADQLDITRDRSNHLAFGHGIHVCIGSRLAELEGQSVFETLAQRFPDVRLVESPDQLEWKQHPVFHGLKKMEITLGADRGRTWSSITEQRHDGSHHHEFHLTDYREYGSKFATIAMRRERGILEMRLHTEGGPLRWSLQAHDELEQAFLDIGRDPDNQVVIMTGTSEEFSGPTLAPGETGKRHLAAEQFDTIGRVGTALIHNLLNIDVPVISAINGPTYRRGRYFLLTGQILTAEEARAMGLINEIVPREHLLRRAWQLADLLLLQTALVRRYSRQLLTHELKTRMLALLGYGLALEGLAQTPRPVEPT